MAELLQRTGIGGAEVDLLVFGTVVHSVQAPNIAREVSLIPHLSKGVQAWTVSRACASANQAITDAADQIVLGHADCAIAGGAESLSNVPILHSRGFSEALVAASRAKTLGGRVSALARIRPRDLVPVTPAIAEPTTGETMGESAEKMAKINHIPREEQDQLALRSHRLAHAGANAWVESCRFIDNRANFAGGFLTAVLFVPIYNFFASREANAFQEFIMEARTWWAFDPEVRKELRYLETGNALPSAPSTMEVRPLDKRLIEVRFLVGPSSESYV